VRPLQGYADCRVGFDTELHHAGDERALEGRDRSLGELARHGLVDVRCSREQFGVNR
jgi:hypothetical protein